VKDEGATGPNKERQEAPHAHWIGVTPGNLFAFVADLGLDEIMMYRFDANKGSLVPHEPAFATLDPGAGPRHIAIHPNGRFVYAVNELKSTVTVFSSAAQKKNQPYLVLKQQVSLLPQTFPDGTMRRKSPCILMASSCMRRTGVTTASLSSP